MIFIRYKTLFPGCFFSGKKVDSIEEEYSMPLDINQNIYFGKRCRCDCIFKDGYDICFCTKKCLRNEDAENKLKNGWFLNFIFFV